jgi:hypothetical protein
LPTPSTLRRRRGELEEIVKPAALVESAAETRC